MGLLFVIFLVVLIYAIYQTQNKDEEKRKRQHAERNAAYLKYKNMYDGLSKKELKKICDETKEQFKSKFDYYTNYVMSHTYTQGDRELTRSEKAPLILEEFANNEPDFYYKRSCAYRLYTNGRLAEDRYKEEL